MKLFAIHRVVHSLQSFYFLVNGRVLLYYYLFYVTVDCLRNTAEIAFFNGPRVRIFPRHVSVTERIMTYRGQVSQYEFASLGNSMSVTMEIGSTNGYRGFHAVFEQI